jgi:hypothetical protein
VKLHLRKYRETVRYFESKERFDEACVQGHGVHHLQSGCIKVGAVKIHPVQPLQFMLSLQL